MGTDEINNADGECFQLTLVLNDTDVLACR